MRQETLRRYISFVLLLILVTVFSLTSDSFFTSANILNMLRECSIIGILAVGVCMVMITGGNDLSCGALLGLNAMLISRLLYVNEVSIGVALLAALAVSICAGMFNGFLVAHLRMPDFIATLSSNFIFSGLILVVSIRTKTGMITTKTLDDPVIKMLGGSLEIGLFYSTIAFIVVAIIGQTILKCTKMGVHNYAIGANRVSAELSGIDFVKVKYKSFIFSAMCAFVGALFFLGKMRAADPESGLGLEFKAISATVIGGCAFSGGRGDVLGTVIGVMFLSVLENGVLKFNFSTEAQTVLTGSIIVAMLIFDAAYNQFMQNRTSKSAVVAREKVKVAAK